MINDLVPMCRDCQVVCQYVACGSDWGLECPRCGKSRVDPSGLKPTKEQAAWRARQDAPQGRREGKR